MVPLELYLTHKRGSFGACQTGECNRGTYLPSVLVMAILIIVVVVIVVVVVIIVVIIVVVTFVVVAVSIRLFSAVFPLNLKEAKETVLRPVNAILTRYRAILVLFSDAVTLGYAILGYSVTGVL